MHICCSNYFSWCLHFCLTLTNVPLYIWRSYGMIKKGIVHQFYQTLHNFKRQFSWFKKKNNKTVLNVNPTALKVLNRLKSILRAFCCENFDISQRLKNLENFLRYSEYSEMNTTDSLYYLATWKLNFMFNRLKIDGS